MCEWIIRKKSSSVNRLIERQICGQTEDWYIFIHIESLTDSQTNRHTFYADIKIGADWQTETKTVQYKVILLVDVSGFIYFHAAHNLKTCNRLK